MIERRADSRALLDFLEELHEAVICRDGAAVSDLLRRRLGRQVPRDVREEVLALALAPGMSMRAPVRLLRFYHVTEQLLLDPPVLCWRGPQLELDLRPRPIPVRVALRRVDRLRESDPARRRSAAAEGDERGAADD